jgi:hypothetical protein
MSKDEEILQHSLHKQHQVLNLQYQSHISKLSVDNKDKERIAEKHMTSLKKQYTRTTFNVLNLKRCSSTQKKKETKEQRNMFCNGRFIFRPILGSP